MFELIDNVPSNAVIKVIGIGGGGGNAVKHMIENSVEGVDFICANTDAQALSDIESKTVLQLGGDITKGRQPGDRPCRRHGGPRTHRGIPARCGHGIHHRGYGWRYRYRWRSGGR